MDLICSTNQSSESNALSMLVAPTHTIFPERNTSAFANGCVRQSFRAANFLGKYSALRSFLDRLCRSRAHRVDPVTTTFTNVIEFHFLFAAAAFVYDRMVGGTTGITGTAGVGSHSSSESLSMDRSANDSFEIYKEFKVP